MIDINSAKQNIGRATKVVLLALFVLMTYTSSLNAAVDEVDGIERKVEFRVPPKSAIEEYGKESRFQYIEEIDEDTFDKPELQEPGDLVKFMAKIITFLAKMFASPIFMWIVISLLVILLVYLVAKYARIDLRAILTGKAKKISNAEMIAAEDDVEETEYSGLIRDAIASGEYRLAIRYLYLQNLKLLAEKNIIQWRANKTNHSYIHEINDAGLKGDFRDSTLIFDYVWYGEIEVDETNFGTLRRRLDDIYKLVGSHA